MNIPGRIGLFLGGLTFTWLLTGCHEEVESLPSPAQKGAPIPTDGERLSSQITATCLALQRHNIPIHVGKAIGGSPLVRPTDSDFVDVCRGRFFKAIEYQKEKSPDSPVRLWDQQAVTSIANFAQAHGYIILFFGLAHQMGANSLSVHGHEIGVGLAAPSLPPDELELGLEHEHGHVRDQEILIRFLSNTKALFEMKAVSAAEARQIVEAHIEAFSFDLPRTEKKRFHEQMLKILTSEPSPKQISVDQLPIAIRILSELLRYGEEVHDQRMENFFFNPDLPLHFRKDPRATENDFQELTHQKERRDLVYLERVTMIARLKEAGLFERVLADPRFEKRVLDSLDPGHIEFFQYCIQRASRFFPVIPEK